MHAPLSHLTAPSSSGSNEGGGEVTRRHIHHTSVALRTGIVPAETLNADSVSATNGHPPPFPNRTSHPPNTPHFQPRFQWSPPPPPTLAPHPSRLCCTPAPSQHPALAPVQHQCSWVNAALEYAMPWSCAHSLTHGPQINTLTPLQTHPLPTVQPLQAVG